MTFKEKLTSLLNCHSADNRSNTPDFILAKYLIGCLNSFDVAVNMREDYYGRPRHHLGSSVEFEPCYCKQCQGKLPAPCPHGAAQETPVTLMPDLAEAIKSGVPLVRHLEPRVRCSCKDFPGSDEFCTAHKFSCLGGCGASVPSKDAYCGACFLHKRLTKRGIPSVPPGHFWRGDVDRRQCKNCGEHYDKHLHTDEASRCPETPPAPPKWVNCGSLSNGRCAFAKVLTGAACCLPEGHAGEHMTDQDRATANRRDE